MGGASGRERMDGVRVKGDGKVMGGKEVRKLMDAVAVVVLVCEWWSGAVCLAGLVAAGGTVSCGYSVSSLPKVRVTSEFSLSLSYTESSSCDSLQLVPLHNSGHQESASNLRVV